MKEENKNNISEYLDSVKDDISSVARRIEELRDDLDKLLSALDREERDESEETFGLLIKAGFVIGTKFQIDGQSNAVWTITGICRDGYIVECDNANGEHQKTTLKTDRKTYIEKIILKLKILKDEVIE